jgi:hypothetical protein
VIVIAEMLGIDPGDRADFKRWSELDIRTFNRDPEVYPEPDGFDVTRREVDHQSFGGGVHFCRGAPSARCSSGSCISASPTSRQSGERCPCFGAWRSSACSSPRRGQLDIHQDESGRGRLGQPEAFLRRLGLHRPVAVKLEDVTLQLPVLLVVLDDQDQLAGHGLTGSVNVNVEP